MRDELKKSLLVSAPAPILCLGLIAPLLAGAPLAANALLGGIAALSLIITETVIAAFGMRIPVNVRTGVSVFLAAGVVVMAATAVSRFPDVKDLPVHTLAPLLFLSAAIASATEAYAVKRKSMAVLFDGIGIGLCFTLALCVCAVLRDAAGHVGASAPGGFFIVVLVALCLRSLRPHRKRGVV